MFQKLRPKIDEIIGALYDADAEKSHKISILTKYHDVQTLLQSRYIELINNFTSSGLYEDCYKALKAKETLFTNTFLDFNTLYKISLILEEYGMTFHTCINARVWFYGQLGYVSCKLGDYMAATWYFYQAEQCCNELDSDSVFYIAFTYHNIAQYFSQVGNYLKADEYYSKCIEMCAHSDDSDLLDIMNYAGMELAEIKARCGQFEEANDYISMLLDYYGRKDLIATVDFIDLLWHYDAVLSIERRYEECCDICNEALNILPKVKDIDQNRYKVHFNNSLAASLSHLHKYAEAIKVLNDIPYKYYTSNTYFTKAIIQYGMEMYDDAINSLYKCLKSEEQYAPLDNRLSVYSALLVTAIDANKQIDVHEIADLFIALFANISEISTSSDKHYLIPVYQIYYEIFLLYCRHFNVDMDVAYNLALCFKGAILQSEADVQNKILSSNDDYLISRYNQIKQLERQITHSIDNQEIQKLKSQVDDIEKELIYELNNNAEVKKTTINWVTIKARLANNEVAIEFVNYMNSTESSEYAALILRKDWDAPKMVVLCSEKELVNIHKLKSNAYSSFSSKKLYNLIWSKLEPYINNGDEVYFSPSGLLYQMNVEVLQDESGRLANEKYNLHRVSSTRELCINRANIKLNSAVLYGGLQYDMDSTAMIAQHRAYSHSYTDVAARGFVADSTSRGIKWDYLEGTMEEVSQIKENLSRKHISATSYMAQAGTEESFKALSGKKTPIIHLATHGFFYTNERAQRESYFEMLNADQTSVRLDNSLKRSGLLLAGAQLAWDGREIPDNVEDGILLAEEIATMDLSGTDLVVLSACETGLGEITSEGVFGLQRAFKKAGVQTLIMSLWKVDDAATKLMMTTFYNEWFSGKSKRAAFVTAQQKVRNEYNNPYYWASFIMLD